MPGLKGFKGAPEFSKKMPKMKMPGKGKKVKSKKMTRKAPRRY